MSLLRHLAARKFGLPAADELARLLGRAADGGVIEEVERLNLD